MATLRKNRLLKLSIFATAGLLVGGTLVVRRGDVSEAGSSPGIPRETLQEALPWTGESRPDTSAAPGSPWQPVAWNDDSSNGALRIASIEGSLPEKVRRPVVTATVPAMRSAKQQAPTATAAEAPNGPSAPAVRVVVRPQPVPSAVFPVSPPDSSPRPDKPVVRVAQSPQWSELSALEADGPSDSRSDQADESPPSETSEQKPVMDNAEVAAERPTVRVEEKVSATPKQELTPAVASAPRELFAPPPIARSPAATVPTPAKIAARPSVTAAPALPTQVAPTTSAAQDDLDSRDFDVAKTGEAASAAPPLAQPKSAQAMRRSAAGAGLPSVDQAAPDAAMAVEERSVRMRTVPPQPVAPWAMPPAARPTMAQQQQNPLPERTAPPVVEREPVAAAARVPGPDVKQAPVVAAAPPLAPAPTPAPGSLATGAHPPALARGTDQAAAPAAAAPRPAPQLPLANIPPMRPPYLAIVGERAQEHIKYGFSLAERGAIYSAETEFNEALLLVAQALDAAERTHVHSEAISAGLRAFREADDFVPRDATQPDIARFVAAHQTPVLKRVETRNMPLLVAMQEYYSYAQYQLSLAGGHEPAAAAALYGLARLQSALGTGNDTKKMMCGPKAIGLHQAALAIDPRNFSAANELGVLLARYGQWPEAQAAFLQSVCTGAQPISFKNLAISYEHLGDMASAQKARAHFEQARREKEANIAGGGDRPTVRMVDPDTFARSSGASDANEMSFPRENGQDRLAERPVASSGQQGPPPPAGNTGAAEVHPVNWLKSKMSAAFSNSSPPKSDNDPKRR